MAAPIVNTPGTKPIAKVVLVARELEAWALTQGVTITLFYGSTTWPDHNNLRCLDAMTASAVDTATGKRLTPAQSIAFGNKMKAYVWSRRKGIGLNWVIWNRVIRAFQNTGRSKNVDRKYTGDNPHVDHIHGEVDNSPYVKPGKLGGVIGGVISKLYPKPKSTEVYVVKLDPGQADSDSVYWVQTALNQVLDGEDIKTTGTYDAATVAQVKRFQALLGDDVDGDLGPLQTNALFARAKIKVVVR